MHRVLPQGARRAVFPVIQHGNTLIHGIDPGEGNSAEQRGREGDEARGLDERLIAPISVTDAGLKAVRAPLLTMNNERLAQALGQPIPGLSTGLERFYQLYQQGYPQMLRRLAEH